MAVSKKTRKRFVYIAYLVPVSFFFVSGGFYDYWNGTLPTVPDEATGRIYVLHFHGTDGYADGTQIAIYWGLPIAAFAFAIIINEIDRYLDRKYEDGP